MPAYTEAWLKGYSKVRSLSKEDTDMIEASIILRRMLLVAWIGSPHDTVQAQAMGPQYTLDTCLLADRYLSKHA